MCRMPPSGSSGDARFSLHVRRLKKPLIEPAEGSRPVNEVHLDDPVFHVPRGIWVAHALRIRWTDPIVILVTRNARMRKFADNMTGDSTAEQPAGSLRALLRIRI